MPVIIPLCICAFAVGITLLYASWRDLEERRVPFPTWYPMLTVAVPMAGWTYLSLFLLDMRAAAAYLVLAAVFCGVFYFSAAYLHLFGGADAWALIFITACIPLFPIEPLLGRPLISFFPFSVLVNAVILNLATPLGIFLWNLWKKNRAPLRYMFVGFPVEGSRIEHAFGFIMEDFYEEEGQVRRRFIGFGEALRRMVRGERRMYTKDLKRDPERYAGELRLYRDAGKVWISYGIPFIVPITAGFFSALFAGDLLFELIQWTLGG
ncbi:MAG: A24 family peptidase C-terminal domain-containing protein [Methanomicrobiaceae archaeon]|nr:A24 family peptidase C-terminal domain-containing protein [Methanomicrobiaceae archaeon]